MGKKKKKKQAKKQPAAANLTPRLVAAIEAGAPGDLAGAGQTGLTPEAFEAGFRAALELRDSGPDPRKIIELPGPFQAAFVAMAEADEDDDLIGDLLEMTAEKEVRKEAKRSLHRLKSRGLDVDLPSGAGPSVLDRAVEIEEKPLPCYLSPVSGFGGRMVLLARYTQGGVAVHQGELDDQDGLVQFAGGTIGRNRYRQMAQEMASDDQGLLEVTYAEGRLHLARAAELTRKAGKSLPDEYLEASGDLGDVDETAAPADPATLMPRDSLEDLKALAARAPELLDLPEFADWLPDEDTVKAIDEKIKAVEEGQLAINDQQRIEQVERAIDAGVDELLGDAERIQRFHQRLLHNAAYLQRTDRDEPARLAAAAAWQLLEEGFEPRQSALFDKLVKKVFRSAEEIVAHMKPLDATGGDEPEGGSNLVVP